jgi:hypothetical protein
MSTLPDYNKIRFNDIEGNEWRSKFVDIIPEADDLIHNLLKYSKRHRLKASQVTSYAIWKYNDYLLEIQALQHEYFFTEPLPITVSGLLKPNKYLNDPFEANVSLETIYEEAKQRGYTGTPNA